MPYKVESLYSPVYELLLSLSLYKRQSHLKYLEVGLKWKEDVEAKISEELLRKIKSKDDLEFADLSVLLIINCPNKEDIQSFFVWLEELSAGEIYEILTPYLDESTSISGSLSNQRSEYIELLQEWNEQYFQKMDLSFLKELENEAIATEKRLKRERSDEVVNSTSRFIVETDKIKKVYLFPAFHFQPMSLVDQFKETLIITYPYIKKEDHFNEILRLTKAISDERRLKILRYISHQSCTFTDIVKEIGMAKGNIHHHLSILRSARLLDIHLKDDKHTYYYQANKGIADNIKESLDFIL
ncbi:ArsR/SmtB family transcription factor [Halobacillus trueperi]|uniref:ArsR/SmtB family transcription factor n=1 Tax=Halobacillus trueperi TaxID=156205 RepID=UPI003736C94E